MAAADPLQHLRDIHMPGPPGWWPPAPGWWLLGALCLVGALWLIWRLAAAARRRRPVAQARRQHAHLFRCLQQGEINARGYLDQSNELVKRVLIHGLGESRARRASGEAWLRLLDGYLGETGFTQGPGRLLGNARFHPELEGDAAQVHPLVERLLARLMPGWTLTARPSSGAGEIPG